MAPRLLVVTHAQTMATRRGAFPVDDDEDLTGDLRPVTLRAGTWLAGPEARCRRTADALGWSATAEPGLADLDAGRWAGRELGDLMTAEPAGVQAWVTDPAAAPHGGESLLDLISRVGATLDGRAWPDGVSVLVVAPLVARAVAVHLLAASPTLMFGIDTPALSAIDLTGQGRWKLRSLRPWPTWVP